MRRLVLAGGRRAVQALAVACGAWALLRAAGRRSERAASLELRARHWLAIAALGAAGFSVRVVGAVLDAVSAHVVDLHGARDYVVDKLVLALAAGVLGDSGRTLHRALFTHGGPPEFRGPSVDTRELLCPARDAMTFSFSGCSWLMMYHVGVGTALAAALTPEQMRRHTFVGTSSGSLVACGLASGIDMSALRNFVLGMVVDARSRVLGPVGRMSQYVRDGLDKLLPADVHVRVRGRLHAQTTVVWPETRTPTATATNTDGSAAPDGAESPSVMGRRYVDFPTREALISTLLASCYIPIYYESPTHADGWLHLDGGLTDNQPQLHDHTVTVSPCAGAASICPAADFPAIFRLFPSTVEDSENIFDAGYADGRAWLRGHGVPVHDHVFGSVSHHDAAVARLTDNA